MSNTLADHTGHWVLRGVFRGVTIAVLASVMGILTGGGLVVLMAVTMK